MTDTPDSPPDGLLESDDFDAQKEQVDSWLEEEKQEREEKQQSES